MNLISFSNDDYYDLSLDEYYDDDYRSSSYSTYTPLDCKSDEEYNFNLSSISIKNRYKHLSFINISFYNIYIYKFELTQNQFKIKSYNGNIMYFEKLSLKILNNIIKSKNYEYIEVKRI